METALINELQGHFDGRGRLKRAVQAIKCYTNGSSFFYAYTDGFGNKRNINLPIEPEDIVPILERYIENIDKDITQIAHDSNPLVASVINLDELTHAINDYQCRYPSTFTSLETIYNRLVNSYTDRKNDDRFDDMDEYHIEVCSDWQDKLYVFNFCGQKNETLLFQLKGIYKI